MSHALATTPLLPPTRDRHAPIVFGVTVDRPSRSLAVTGEFDHAAVGHFLGAAAILLGAGSGDVTVDLAAVQFVDAAGLGALVTVRNAVTADGSALVLRDVDPRVRRVFGAGGLTALLPEAP